MDPAVKAALGDEIERERLPSVRNMLALRKTSNNQLNEAYVYFCEKFLKHVVGVNRFNREFRNNRNGIMGCATVTDEALALLQLENSEIRWSTEFSKSESGIEVNQNELPQPLYTSGGQNKNDQKGFTKRHGGWTRDGIIRFNVLCTNVEEDREKNGKWFDDVLRARTRECEEEADENPNKTSGRDIISAYDEMVYPSFNKEDDGDDEVGETAEL